MARSTLAQLITAVRLLIDDPAKSETTTATFTDQQIQDALDHTRQDINYLELAPKQTIQAGGRVVWLDYYAMQGSAGLGDWEQDAVLQGYPSFATLSPITSDFLVGHWTFDTSLYSTGQRPPTYITGKTFDRYAAAAELLEDWAATRLDDFDFSTDRQGFNVSQKRQARLDLATRYRARARTRTLQMVRTDAPQNLWQRGRFDMNRTTF